MTGRPVNELQVKVLRWIADGSAPTTGTRYKTSAYALQGRGLVTVDRRRGKWRAEITEAGRHYLAHGTYPASKPAAKPTARPRPPRTQTALPIGSEHQLPTATESGRPGTQPEASRFAGTPELPVASRIRAPHPAVRELVDNPKRVDLPMDVRRRVHLISHTLVEEALRRGWKVVAVKREVREEWYRARGPWGRSNDLFRIDAGEQEVGVQFRVKTRRTDHVDTPEEVRDRARGRYVWAPRYDYHPTDVLRLFLYHDTHQEASWEDTARVPIESRLAEVLDRIEQSTKVVIARREAERKRWEAEQRRRAEEERQQERVADYDSWLDALLDLRRRMREHTELGAVVTQLRQHSGQVDDEDTRAQLDAFVSWAQTHLEESDPFTKLDLPTGEPPEMTYAEWDRWKAYFDDKKRRSALPWHLR